MPNHIITTWVPYNAVSRLENTKFRGMLTVLKIVFPLIMRKQRVFCFNKRKIHIQGLYQDYQIIKKNF